MHSFCNFHNQPLLLHTPDTYFNTVSPLDLAIEAYVGVTTTYFTVALYVPYLGCIFILPISLCIVLNIYH